MSFCLEYWSDLLNQVNQPGVRNWICLSNSLSEKAELPTMLICLIVATSPSSIVKSIATRLRSCGVTVVVMITPYLPRDRYKRLSSCSARSISALS